MPSGGRPTTPTPMGVHVVVTDSCHPRGARGWLVARDRSPRWGHVVVGGPHGVQGTVDDGVVVAVGGAVEGSGWRGVLWRVRGTFGLVNWGCCPGAYPPWASRWGAVNLTPGAGPSAYWVGPRTLRGPSSFSCIW